MQEVVGSWTLPNLQISDWCLLGFKMFVMTVWGDLGLVLVSVCNTICTEHEFV